MMSVCLCVCDVAGPALNLIVASMEAPHAQRARFLRSLGAQAGITNYHLIIPMIGTEFFRKTAPTPET